MNNKRTWIVLGILAVLGISAGIGWALMGEREAADVRRVKEIAQQMIQSDGEMDDEQRDALRDEMRQIRDNTPEERREEVFGAMRDQFMQRMRDRVREFASLSEDEKNVMLDEDIDRMEEMRKRWQESGRDRGGRGRGGPPGAGGGDRGGDRARGGGEGRGGEGRQRDRSPEGREQRRRERLDRISAEDRAYMTEYRNAINRRREERGLEPMRGRGPR